MVIDDSNEVRKAVKSIIKMLLSLNPVTSVINVGLSTYQNESKHLEMEEEIDALKTQIESLNSFRKEILDRFDVLLAELPDAKVHFPEMDVVFPLSQSVLINGLDEMLKEMYVNLFLNASSEDGSKFVHPSFAGIINQMTVDEVKLMKSFENSPSRAWPVVNIIDRGCTVLTNYTTYGLALLSDKNKICTYIDNLCRLNLIFVETGVQLVDESQYEPLKDIRSFVGLIDKHIFKHTVFTFEYHVIRLTNLGRLFKRACFNQDEV